MSIITPKCMLSYPHLAKPQPAQEGGKEKYSAALVFLAGADLAPLKAAVLRAAEAKWPGKAAKMFENGSLRSPFRKDSEEKGYPEGSVFFNARSERRPGCVLADRSPVDVENVPEVFYPGCFVRASLDVFAYDRAGNKGVTFALNNLQKLGDGDRLDNRVAAEDEFEAVLDETPSSDVDSLL